MTAPGTRSAENGTGEAAPRARRAAHGGSLTRGVRLVTITLMTLAFSIPVGATWARVAEGSGPETDHVGIASGSAGATPVPHGLGGPQSTPTSGSLPAADPGRLPDAMQSPSTAMSTLDPAPTTVVTPTPVPTPTPRANPTWVNVLNDQFDSGGVPAHLSLYNGPYGSGPGNCAVPSHVTVSGGSMNLLMDFETSGACGAGWYTAGMQVNAAFGSVDQRVTVRFRIVRSGVSSHFIIPMRWPDTAPWPKGGEEDYCEGDLLTGCSTYLHYGSSNSQTAHDYSLDVSQWHTIRTQRLNHVVKVFIDDMTTPVWSYTGSSTTLPDTVKRVLLQQECQSGGCPSGTAGTEDIQIDWITIDNPS